MFIARKCTNFTTFMPLKEHRKNMGQPVSVLRNFTTCDIK